MKLIELDPRFLKRTSRLTYEPTDDIASADALVMKCPACHWSNSRLTVPSHTHDVVVWGDGGFKFDGRFYDDLTLRAGIATVAITAGHTRFTIKRGRVDFY